VSHQRAYNKLPQAAVTQGKHKQEGVVNYRPRVLILRYTHQSQSSSSSVLYPEDWHGHAGFSVFSCFRLV